LALVNGGFHRSAGLLFYASCSPMIIELGGSR
jgi:hypothetical protein